MIADVDAGTSYEPPDLILAFPCAPDTGSGASGRSGGGYVELDQLLGILPSRICFLPKGLLRVFNQLLSLLPALVMIAAALWILWISIVQAFSIGLQVRSRLRLPSLRLQACGRSAGSTGLHGDSQLRPSSGFPDSLGQVSPLGQLRGF